LLDGTTWSAHAASTWGRCPDVIGTFQVTSASTKGVTNDCTSLIRINEIESSGGTPGDWVELYNPGPSLSDVSGWMLKDNDDTHAYTIPAGTVVPAGGYLVLDEATIEFGLGGGDSARLFRADGSLHDSYSWTAHPATTYGRCPNGTGAFATTVSSTKAAANDCVNPAAAIVINEIESNAGTPGDWAELMNVSTASINVSGWTMVDNNPSSVPYVIPDGTTITPGGFLVLEEAQFRFGLGSADSVTIADAAGAPVTQHSWSAHAAVTLGRCPDATGDFVVTLAPTKAALNACGSPVVINEVDSDGGVPGDWVELYNPTNVPADISGFTLRDSADGTGYVVPAGNAVPALGYLVLEQAEFGLELDAADNARLFDGTQLVDDSVWTEHAGQTYGRCPDGTGAFANTIEPTKGAQNHCVGIPFFGPWPGGSAISVVDDPATFISNMSGLDHEPGVAGAPDVLWAVRNGPGTVFKLTWNGTVWAPDAASDWGTGRTLQYPGGDGDVDSEGVTLAGGSGATIYVGAERNNSDSGVSRNAVLQFDTTAAGATLSAVREWNLTGDLPATNPNAGIEAISWVPDSFLTTNGFFDEASGSAYDPNIYPDHGDGLFFVGVEATGGIYAYALNHNTGGFTRIATIASGLAGVMALDFDAELGNLWAVCDDTCTGRSAILQIENGAFTVINSYERPADMPNINNEGFAVAALDECVGGLRPVFYSDDSDTGGNSLRQSTLPCPP
jgi:Lamin Tail Domain